MDKETKAMFNAVFAEFDKLNRRFDGVENELKRLDSKIDYVNESLTHEINACKMDNATVALLVKKTDKLDGRVSALEEKRKRRERFRLL